MITDGENVTFYFDLLDFEDERMLPKAVEVRDYGDRTYRKRVSPKQRREIADQAAKLRERLGPDVESQRHLLRDTYRR